MFHVVDQEVAKMRLQGEEINKVDIPLTLKKKESQNEDLNVFPQTATK